MEKIVILLYAAAAMYFLPACSSGNNFQFNLPPSADSDDISVHYIEAPDKIKLASREMGSAGCTTGFVFILGSTMYGYYYVPLIKELSKYNIYVRVIDIRGHGDSEGIRGDVPSENSLVEDLELHIKDLKSKNPQMNIFIGGHSMGGGICGRYLEYFGYDAVKGVVYIAPFFHWKQSGMKNLGYVDVSVLKFLFGGDRAISEIYHPNSTDPKLVRQYSNMMGRASMVSDYSGFRKNHTANTIFIIGQEDELFDWEQSMMIFNDKKIKYIVLEHTGHLNFKLDALEELGVWMKR